MLYIYMYMCPETTLHEETMTIEHTIALMSKLYIDPRMRIKSSLYCCIKLFTGFVLYNHISLDFAEEEDIKIMD